jgi:hypothetical protein
MQTFEGIYENGVVRLLGPSAPPEHSHVTVVVKASADANSAPSGIGSNSDELYKLLDARYNSGFSDTAARHNEHQP